MLVHDSPAAALPDPSIAPAPAPRIRVTPPPLDDRADAIITEIARRFGLAPGLIYERRRDGLVPQARQTAMWALSQIGHTPAAIARLFGLKPSTALYGIRRVEERSDWQELAGPALNLLGAGGQRLALAAWLDRGLPPLDERDRRAVHAYATCSLLGWEQQPPQLCSSGMLLVLRDARIRAALEEALRRIEQEAHIARIAWHAARMRAG